MMLSLDTAYRSFGGEVEASSTPTICRLPDSRRHQLSAIAPSLLFFWAHLDWLGWSNNPVLETKLFLFVSVPFGLACLCTLISVSNKGEFDRVREPPR